MSRVDREIVLLIDHDELASVSTSFHWVTSSLKGPRLVGGASLHGTREQLLALAARIVKEVGEES